MNGYVKRTEQKKQAILSAAQELFFSEGTSVGIAEIAKKAKVSQVTIYNYFGSKDKLLREVVLRFASKGVEACQAILAEDIPFAKKMEMILTDISDHYSAPMTQQFTESVDWDNPTIVATYQEISRMKMPVLQKLVQQGKAEGAIHESITWEAFMAYTSAVASIKLRSDYLKTSAEYKWAISRLFFYGLIGK